MLGAALHYLSRIPKLRRVCLWVALKLEGGQFYSYTARQIMRDRYGVTIGAYSYGSCFTPGNFPEGVSMGRYVSTARGIKIFRRNHPTDWLSTHPFFFNSRLGFVDRDRVNFLPLVIGDDAWIAENVIITPGCSRIGLGAILAAGAIVTRDVPDFAIVGGNPAKLIRYRFAEDLRSQILNSQWWNRSIEELQQHKPSLISPLSDSVPIERLSSSQSTQRPNDILGQ